jgi:peptidoglycan/LPS O-acetylase OafA/YrhL
VVDADVALDSTYRKDIQGLRGVAVLAVVAYHIGLPIHGGFIGVDIFFTISGYVISQAIANDINSSDGFRLRTFFARRIYRLIPLLTVVNISIMLFAFLSFSPFGAIGQVTSAIRSSTGFYANFHFYNSNNYLDLVANPARHLWSLSVEEQFYFIFHISISGCVLTITW